MSNSGHGSVGTREQPFTSILEPTHPAYDVQKLAALAAAMKGDPDTVKDGPDPEENLWVPAGYTYFGQFVDHDLTFDSTSSLNPDDASDPAQHDRIPTNLRTPRLDLDCLYGDGPDAQPFMYADDGATLLYGGTGRPIQITDATGKVTVENTTWDLLRAPNGRAIIGDKRNDENSIVCQIQLGFVKYHNAIVRKLKHADSKSWNDPSSLFKSARNEVRWTYQKLIVEDFLPRIISHDVLADLHGKRPDERAGSYVFYDVTKRGNLPREFVVAAYRFGHSGVRTGYRLNTETRLSIFPSSNDTNLATDSLLGFDPLPKHHVIDNWDRFFPTTEPGAFTSEDRSEAAGDTPAPQVRLQLAYKLDPTIVDPLGVLPRAVAGDGATQGAIDAIKPPAKLPDPQRPSLALLNLLRGNAYKIQGGQAYAELLAKKFPQAAPLASKYLVTRQGAGDALFRFAPIDAAFQADTPLWFYILAEAQKPVVDAMQLAADGTFDEKHLLTGPGAKTQLGWVGGRIIAEVMYGLLDSDPESYVSKAPASWKPILGGDQKLLVRNLLKVSGSVE